jgi:hypothetical protein
MAKMALEMDYGLLLVVITETVWQLQQMELIGRVAVLVLFRVNMLTVWGLLMETDYGLRLALLEAIMAV